MRRMITVLATMGLLVGLAAPGGAQAAGDVTINRVAGENRFATAAAITAYGLEEFWDDREARQREAEEPVSGRSSYVVNALAFPDALAASAATWGEAAILPVEQARATAWTVDVVDALRITSFTAVGGESVVADEVIDELMEAARERARRDNRGAVFGAGRVSGPDRWVTGVALARGRTNREGFSGTIYLASGTDFPDALAGGAAAAAERAALVLNPPDAVHPNVRQLLEDAQPERLVILGGAAAISPQVEDELRARFSFPVTRLSGPDRFATAVEISRTRAAGQVDEVMIATGTGFADALAAGPASAQLAAPLLLVAPDALPQVVAEELTRLAPCTVTVVGGRNAVSDEVAEAAAEAASEGGPDC
jgi:hypothetical protein